VEKRWQKQLWLCRLFGWRHCQYEYSEGSCYRPSRRKFILVFLIF